MKQLLKRIKIAFVLIGCTLVCLSCKEQNKKEHFKTEETSRVAYLPYYNEESFTPRWITPGTDEEQQFHKIPDFRFINQLGDTVTQKTFENKIYITDFFFASCPGICPQMTGNMFKLQEEFKEDDDVLLLSHTVTPTRDSVSVLKNYADKHGVIDDKWHLVTGDKLEIYNLGRTQYFVENDLGEPKNIDDFLHTENFLLIDKHKHIRGIYNGLNRASMLQLITDVKALKKENYKTL
ncbi:SCO family protein [Psychroserpens algicola]|uniref:SCO family protein n=1 Tax=Psychroserpens algicola TaxID=1719034 RepID=UPI00195302C5|nr:SCO family protein [Psychroserpens algicola]